MPQVGDLVDLAARTRAGPVGARGTVYSFPSANQLQAGGLGLSLKRPHSLQVGVDWFRIHAKDRG